MMKQTEKIINEKIQGKALFTENKAENTKKLFIESYGCQMNMNDSEIVASILDKEGYNTTQVLEEADLVLVNTCSIREKAETTVRRRLQKYNAVKKVNPTINKRQTFPLFFKLKLQSTLWQNGIYDKLEPAGTNERIPTPYFRTPDSVITYKI